MNLKGIGAILLISGCSGAGFSIAFASRREVKHLQDLVRAISYMENELQYSLRPLPELCRQAGKDSSGTVREILLNLARELDWQSAPDVYACMCEALAKSQRHSAKVHHYFLLLGGSLGRFDLNGQLRDLESIRLSCEEESRKLNENQDTRLRSYRTLGICTGAALAILLA